jgi:hypothetical protein
MMPHSAPNRQLKWSARLKSSDVEVHGKVLSRIKNEMNKFGYFGVACLTETSKEG